MTQSFCLVKQTIMFKAIRISDPDSGACARIVPELGFNCFSFDAVIDDQKVSVIDSPADVLTTAPRASSYGTPLLFPFPNRIRNGAFDWEGKSYQIPTDSDHPNSIHGFCLDRPWRVIEKTKQTVTGQFQLSVDAPDRQHCWPSDFIFEVRYRVAENRLESQFRITNPGTVPLPWGLGTHTYFRLPFGKKSSATDCVFSAPVSEEWVLEAFLPIGHRIPVENNAPLRQGIRFGEHRCDNVYTGWQSDGGTVRTSVIDENAGIELTQVCDAEYFRELIVYCPPDREAVCMEPYTCVTDAINLHARDLNTGLQILAPGGVVQTWCALQVNPVLV